MTIKVPQSLYTYIFKDHEEFKNTTKATAFGLFGAYIIKAVPDIEFTKVVKKGQVKMVKQIINEKRVYK